jgi:signal transduction histidine kinase
VIRLAHLGLSLRTRLTLWYGALLALSLIGFSLLLYFTLERSLSSSVDQALELRAEQMSKSLLKPSAGVFLQPQDIPPDYVESRPLDEFAAPGIYPQAINPRGSVIFAPPNLPGAELPVTAEIIAAMRGGQITMTDLPLGDSKVRVRTVPVLGSRGNVVGGIQVGQSLAPLEATMAAVSRLLFTAGLTALVFAAAVGWLFTRRALQPVSNITATARHIAATGDYSRRLDVATPHLGRGDELFFLANTFNDMIARLEQVLESQRRLLADTSHELRNPLTVIRGNLALLRREGAPEDARREAVLEAEEEAMRMGRLVNDLLLLARADAGQLPALRQDTVDLVELAEEVVDQARLTAGGRVLSVAAAGVVRTTGDRDRLKQLVANLVENAIRYTPDSGRVSLTVSAQPRRQRAQRSADVSRSQSAHEKAGIAVLTVSDTGQGIAPEHLPHLFERFYRADKARPRADGGSGLGLSIVQYIADAHGGAISATSEGIGRGSTFHVELPLVEDAPEPVAEKVRRRRPSARRLLSMNRSRPETVA